MAEKRSKDVLYDSESDATESRGSYLLLQLPFRVAMIYRELSDWEKKKGKDCSEQKSEVK